MCKQRYVLPHPSLGPGNKALAGVHFVHPRGSMAGLLNSLSTAVSPYILPVVEKNLAPDFVVRFGRSHVVENKTSELWCKIVIMSVCRQRPPRRLTRTACWVLPVPRVTLDDMFSIF